MIQCLYYTSYYQLKHVFCKLVKQIIEEFIFLSVLIFEANFNAKLNSFINFKLNNNGN